MSSWFTVPSDPRQRILSVTIPDCAANVVVVPPPCNGSFVGAYASSEGNPGGGGATININKSGTTLASITIPPAGGQTVCRSTTPIANKVIEFTGAPLIITTTGGGAGKAVTVLLYFLAAQ